MKKVNLRPFAFLFIFAGVGLISGTFAYFTTETSLSNKFTVAKYQNTITETFVSPSDWKPGDVTSKSMSVTNTGDVSMAVRVSYTEKWEDSNGDTLPLKVDDLPVVTIVNTSTNWFQDGDYYYYNGELLKDATVEEELNLNIGFSSAITNSNQCTVSNNVTTCTSTGTGYDGATYTLELRIETAQFNAYKEVWNTNVQIPRT